MIKKVDPESHKTFKRKITESCLLVEIIMIARVIIFYLKFFDPVLLSEQIDGTEFAWCDLYL